MKKLLAIFLSFAVMLSVLVIPSVFITNAETAPIYYVDANGNDENDGLTDATPLATIVKAQQLITSQDISQEGTIIVIDSAEFNGGIPHTGMITIKGYDGESTLTYASKEVVNASGTEINAVIIQGPTTFDNIICPTSSATNYKSLVTGGYKVIFNLPLKEKAEKIIYVGQVDSTPENTRENVVFNNIGGAYDAYNVISIGSQSKTNTVSAGVDVEVNAGRVASIKLEKGTTYSGNINIVLNNFNKRGNNSTAFTNNKPEINAAFQMIINNGRFSQFSSSAITNMNSVSAKDGSWILRAEKATDGTLLDTSDETGKFIVNGGMVANAYKVVDNVESETPILSVNGILDLSSAPGIYNVKYTTRTVSANSDSVVYVDTENGSDLADGSTANTPFKTLQFASDWLSMSDSSKKEIVIIGDAVYSLEEHDYKLTISGYDETSTLKMSDSIKGDTVIKNILLSFDGSKDIKIDGNEVVYENVTYTTYTAKGKIIVGPMDSDTSDDVHKAVFNGLGSSGHYAQVRIGKIDGTTNGDIDIVVNDGIFWGFSCEGTNTYNGNVSLTVNGGSVYNSDKNIRYFFRGLQNSTFNGGLQFIVNNESYNSYSKYVEPEFLNATAKGGKWLIFSKAFDDAHSAKLSTTDVAGTYNVIGAKYAKAINSEDETKVYYSENGVLIVPAGTYNVSYFNVLKQGDANCDGNLDIRDLVSMKADIVANKPLELTIDLDNSKKNDAGDITILSKHFLNVEKIEWNDTLNYLSNTYTKLVNDKKLTVAFIGGSVTETPDEGPLGWPTLICNWLGEKYNAEITEVRAGKSGTNSYFGVHRFDNEVGQYKPDLFFIEFAHNDYGPLEYDTVKRTTESLIHKAYSVNPNCDIIFVLNTADDVKTQNYGTLRGHRETAEKYGLKTIKMGDKFYEHLEITGIPRDYYIKDSVHPNVEGNALYAKIISEQINRDLPYTNYATNDIIDHTKSLPEPLHSPMIDARMLDAKDIDLSNSTGWSYDPNGTFVAWKGYDIYDGVFFATEPGSVLRFEFEGKGLGLLFSKKTNIGKISVSIDDSEPVIIDGYDSSAKPGHLPITPILEDLENGTHTVTVTLLEERNEKSTSNRFQIPAFLIR